MKRKEFTSKVLNMICGTTNNNTYVYCDRSVSKNPKNKNKFFFRCKVPGSSSNYITSNFEGIKRDIMMYLESIGEYEAYVKLNHSKSYCFGKFNYIEIVFPNGKPWDNKVTSMLNDVEFSSHPSIHQETVIVEKTKLANLIRVMLIKTHKYTNDELFDIDDDTLIEIFNQVR